METRIVTINLSSRSYDIYIGAGLIYRILDFIPEDITGKNLFIIHDENVTEHAKTIEDILKNGSVKSVSSFALKPGESSKSLSSIEKITDWMLANGVNRKSMVLALGGGVTGDIAGFCASITLRGIPYIQIPTTLLSQVDSSVGGKTGINTAKGKNLIGSFYQPSAVIIDIDFLKTLPPRELLAGYAEIVKYGLINNSAFFAWLEQNGTRVCELESDVLVEAIETSVKSKASIVEKDEKEEDGKRALLNLGHTFGHALETAAGYNGSLLHGEAVSIGMVMALELSSRMKLCEREDVERLEAHLTKVGLPIKASTINPPLTASVDKIMEIMRQDKKITSDKMTFILAGGIGQTFLSDEAPQKLVREVVKESLGGDAQGSTRQEFKLKGIKGLWRSAFSSQS